MPAKLRRSMPVLLQLNMKGPTERLPVAHADRQLPSEQHRVRRTAMTHSAVAISVAILRG
jgi:hypothetical protein